MSPLVTILMPVRNAASTLPDCLASIAAQTCGDYELLVVDDHCSDDSVAILARYAARDSRCRILANVGRGLVDALNTGLAQASADLVARMDADDVMAPGRLAAQQAHLCAHPAVEVLGCCVTQFPQVSDGNREYLRWQNNCLSADDIRDEIYVESPFAHPSVMFRRDTVVRAGSYCDGDYPEDYELWLRLQQRGCRMEKLDVPLLRWRDSPGRLTRTDPRYRRSAFDALRARYLSRDPRLVANRERLVIWGAGRRTRQRCAHLIEHGFRPAAWIDIDPRKIGNRVGGAWVRPPGWLETRSMFVLGYVTNHGARDDIAGWLGHRGFERGRDYLMVG